VQPPPALGGVVEIMKRHARLLVELKGDEAWAVRDFRKHTGWYLTGYAAGGELRRSLSMASSLAELDALLDEPRPHLDAARRATRRCRAALAGTQAGVAARGLARVGRLRRPAGRRRAVRHRRLTARHGRSVGGAPTVRACACCTPPTGTWAGPLHRADLRDGAGRPSCPRWSTRSGPRRVDAVLVAGDVYDRAVPPLDAVAMFEESLSALRGAGARVGVTSGNHDSARRLGIGSRLVDGAGVHLRTPRVPPSPSRSCSRDAHGPVAVYGLPYLEPEAVRHELPPQPGRP
jgi:hypothetical protein